MAQRKGRGAAAGGSFRLRRVLLELPAARCGDESPTCDLPVRGRGALRTRPAAVSPQRMLPLQTVRCSPLPGSGPFANSGRLRAPRGPPSGCPTPRSGRRPALAPPYPRLTAAGARSTTSPPRPCPGEVGAALCAARSGLRRPRPGELGTAVGLSLSSPHALPLKKSLLQV
ncbi:hypothetical protein NN561_015189 [Cricetulus griseus]